MGLQENSFQESVKQFFSVVWYFVFFNDCGGVLITVNVPLTRINDPMLLKKTSQESRGNSMTAEWCGAHLPL